MTTLRSQARDAAADKFLLVVLGAAFCVRMGFAFWASIEPISDYDAYDRMGRNIVAGLGWHSRGLSAISPGYPALLAVIYVVTQSHAAVWILQAVLGTFTVFLTFLTSLQLWPSKRIARGSAAFVAFYPDLILYSGLLASENLAIPLCIAFILAVIRGADGRMGAWIVAGLFLGMLCLTRGMLLLLSPLLLVWQWVEVRDVCRVARTGGLTVAVSFLVLSPWSIRNWVVHDAFVPVTTECKARGCLDTRVSVFRRPFESP